MPQRLELDGLQIDIGSITIFNISNLPYRKARNEIKKKEKESMINTDTKLQGRRLLSESLAFRHKKIVYPSSYNAALVHAGVDAATHLKFGSFARLFFSATQGQSGKSRSTEVSYFFVQNPVAINSSSGAGLIKMLNDKSILRPTLLVDEAQDYYHPNGNQTIRALLNSYTAAWPRIISDDRQPKGYTIQELFYPVLMNGLTNKKNCYIPENFLERCIQIKLPKKLDIEEVDNWIFVDEIEGIGDSIRAPWMDWARDITKADLKGERDGWLHKHLNINGIRDRNEELFRPVLETLYCCGDDYFDEGIAAVKYLTNNLTIKLTINLELLRDIHIVIAKQQYDFVYNTIVDDLKKLSDTWLYYDNDGLEARHLKPLLEEFEIFPGKDKTGNHRGFALGQFMEPWLRLLGLGMPEHLKEHFK